MNRLRFVLLLGAFALLSSVALNCGGGPPPPGPDAGSTTDIDTMPAIEVDTTTPPPPPKLKESQLVTLYFELDKFALRTDARAALDENYKLMTEFSDVIIKIEGHCDERGTVEYNLSLGEKRAQATMDYLNSLGIAPERMSIVSYGKERPVDNSSNETAWSKNRRCEFRIVSQ